MSIIKEIKEQRHKVRKSKQEIVSLLRGLGESVTDLEADGIEIRSLEAKTLAELRVAAIMDEFTLACFKPECQLTELTPAHWQEEMEQADPELLFIESAWQGKDRLWYGKVNRCAAEVRELVAYAKERHIPVVFWCKEDPVHTDTFMVTARLADMVFTTDAECIAKYKRELGHDRVYHLHFGAQPSVHNPLEKYERKDKFCFAGSYYHRYAERCKVFDAFADFMAEHKGLDIYDRNFGKPGPMTKFPEKYNSMILGNLPTDEIDVAYKGYRFGINMSSITQSQTMFARRVFELMASNTLVVSNFCRGIKNYFGDLVICTDDVKTLENVLKKRCADSIQEDKLRLAALRAVLREHLCEDRLDEVVERVFGRSLKKKLPSIAVLARVGTQQEAERVERMFKSQTYESKSLLLMAEEKSLQVTEGTLISSEDIDEKISAALAGVDYLAWFEPEDWYGENYLLDMALSTRYGAFDVIGKDAYFSAEDGEPQKHEGKAYRLAENLPVCRSMVRVGLVEAGSLTGDMFFSRENMLSIDAFNYCEKWPESKCPAAQDVVLSDMGLTMAEIRQVVDNIKVEPAYTAGAYELAAAQNMNQSAVKVTVVEDKAVIDSHLPNGKHTYLYLEERLDLADLMDENRMLTIQCLWHGKLSIMCGCEFCDANGKVLDTIFIKGREGAIQAVPEAVTLRILYRVCGTGVGTMQRIFVYPGIKASNDFLLERTNALLITNLYPAPDDLYRHMFVHKRVLAYKEDGLNLDIMLMRKGQERAAFREFEGINVFSGNAQLLSSAFWRGAYQTICVHFMDRAIWEALKPHLNSRRFLIWCHGSEIQPWQRRAYKYKPGAELEKAKIQSAARMKLWREIFVASEKYDIHFIFVSEYFAQEVFEDNGYELDKSRYTVVHNFIDGNLFAYEEKKPEDRLSILSIKSYDDAKYANDLTAKAIAALSERSCFEKLHFSLYGQGKDFDTINNPLKAYENVELHECFLTQQEIAELHRSHGVYIGTTRMDAQGVSRDEAMASGLVPIANAVAAIPEFVDENCGILVPGEDYMAVADAIEKLYNEPELFLKLSRNAAERVRRQSGYEKTIAKEIELIRNR